MKRFRPALIGATVLAAVGIAVGLIAPASATVASYSPPSNVLMGSTATIEARGAAVTVPVIVVCPAGYRAYFYVHVTERTGSGTASGYTYNYFTCTGAMQHLDVTVTADYGNAFKQGTAWGEASLSWGMSDQLDQHDIELVK